MEYDFSGYATKNDLKCSDGRIIRRDAFKDNDGTVVPLVWQHLHDDPINVLGHAVLENREDGVYAYCSFNDSEQANHAKTLVKHGDINAMSIFANKLKQQGENVVHGIIREVSLVLAGANPGATIQNLSFSHSDGSNEYLEDEAIIHTDALINVLSHADTEDEKSEEKSEDDETVEDVIATMNEKQQNAMYYLVEQAYDMGKNGEVDEDEDENDVEHSDEDDDEEVLQHSEEGDDSMKHNVFESDTDENVISHSEIMAAIADGIKGSSMKDAFIAHGIENLDVLFPEAKLVTPTPEMIARPNAWVSEVWNGLKKSPFARIKSTAANLTADDARAKGYIKGKQKLEEQFSLLKRVTTPQTVYKLQKMDRDDVIDITDIDVIAWLKAEMRMMLDEELARAVLVGDGRSAVSEDKIKEDNIRPIYQDDDMYTIHYGVALSSITDETDRSNTLVDAIIRARKGYMGSGNPAMYASTDVINDLLLAKDKIGRRLYSTVSELADTLRVSKIVEVPVLEGVKRTDDDSNSHDLLALIVNLNDYTVGADKGGEVSLFDDFDLNFNKYEYLIETRCSGALTKPYSAIAIETADTDTDTDTDKDNDKDTDKDDDTPVLG